MSRDDDRTRGRSRRTTHAALWGSRAPSEVQRAERRRRPPPRDGDGTRAPHRLPTVPATPYAGRLSLLGLQLRERRHVGHGPSRGRRILSPLRRAREPAGPRRGGAAACQRRRGSCARDARWIPVARSGGGACRRASTSASRPAVGSTGSLDRSELFGALGFSRPGAIEVDDAELVGGVLVDCAEPRASAFDLRLLMAPRLDRAAAMRAGLEPDLVEVPARPDRS
jgi:hypothetical protein